MITPRASYFGAALLKTGLSEERVLAMTVRKAMTEADWATINS